MTFAPHTDDDVRTMLDRIGLERLDQLFEQIPPSVRLDGGLDLPEGVSEMQIVADLRELADRNLPADRLVCFAGAGAYDHYVPAVVWALAGRSEFYTSYTPYQPELSQGVLQALFEYQSMIAEITGLEVSNASLYEGATALAEAVNLARRHPGRGRVVVSGGVDPRYVQTLETYGRGAGYEPEVFDLERGSGGGGAAGAHAVQVFDPLSLGVLAPPGELGADIAVAEGQPLGNQLAFGGPYLGVIATRRDHVRRLPGRIVGETVDVDGRPGYVLTLPAPEQHIRREKATSNICTNQ